jgi:deoxyribose-phosphate aldolase
MLLTRSDLAAMIDHTHLKLTGGRPAVEQACQEAREHRFHGVCVNPIWAPAARGLLAGSAVQLVVVVGFPLGQNRPDVKAFEAARAVEDGADEVEVVLDLGAVKAREASRVEDDVGGVVRACGDRPVRVFLETCYLKDDELVLACEAVRRAGAQGVETSTGFGPGGATVEHVALLRAGMGPGAVVKASGGVRTLEDALKMVAAGANRIGTSSGILILAGLKAGGNP